LHCSNICVQIFRQIFRTIYANCQPAASRGNRRHAAGGKRPAPPPPSPQARNRALAGRAGKAYAAFPPKGARLRVRRRPGCNPAAFPPGSRSRPPNPHLPAPRGRDGHAFAPVPPASLGGAGGAFLFLGLAASSRPSAGRRLPAFSAQSRAQLQRNASAGRASRRAFPASRHWPRRSPARAFARPSHGAGAQCRVARRARGALQSRPVFLSGLFGSAPPASRHLPRVFRPRAPARLLRGGGPQYRNVLAAQGATSEAA
jgi:hypothetical protein